MDFRYLAKAKRTSDSHSHREIRLSHRENHQLPQMMSKVNYSQRSTGVTSLVSQDSGRAGTQTSERKLTPRELVMKEFISPMDIEAIERAIRSTNTIIGFRAAGPATLRRLEAGAAPKPHVILDKSLKARDFEASEEEPDTIRDLMIQHLEGFVPYKEEGKIMGLHLSSMGVAFFKGVKEFHDKVKEITGIEDRYYLECKPTSASDKFVQWLLRELDSNSKLNYASWFVTGDYDMHDMILKTSQPAPVPSDSYDEKRIRTKLNEAMQAGSGSRKRQAPLSEELSRIQHGPQYSYIAHMKDREKGKPIVEKVADLDLRVALYDGKEWTILDHSLPENLQSGSEGERMRERMRARQAEALEGYYGSHGAHLKWSWRDTPDAIAYIKGRAQQGGGMVSAE